MVFTESFATVILWQLLFAQAEHCNKHDECLPPKRCCDYSCCYMLTVEEDSNKSNMSFKYSSGLNVWNLWYFWFILLLLLITCCSGCGYWRRRNLLAAQQQNLTDHGIRNAHMGIIAEVYPTYIRPHPFLLPRGYESSLCSDPPPYSEVVKNELPPYSFEEVQHVCDDTSGTQHGGPDQQSNASPEGKNNLNDSKLYNPNTLPKNPPPYSSSQENCGTRTLEQISKLPEENV